MPKIPVGESPNREFRRLLTEERRLALLKLMRQCPAQSANSKVLLAGVLLHGHAVSSDRMRVDLAWLEEMELVHLREHEGSLVVTLTERGDEVAAGVVRVPGVGLKPP